MNYNNKLNHNKVYSSEYMAMNQSVVDGIHGKQRRMCESKQQLVKGLLSSCLLITVLGTTSLLVGCGSEIATQGVVDAGSTSAPSVQNAFVQQKQNEQSTSALPDQNEQTSPDAQSSNTLATKLDDLSSKVTELSDAVAELKKEEETRRQEEAKTAPLWQILLFALLIVLGLVLLTLLIKAKWVQLQNQLKQLEGQTKLNTQQAVNPIKTEIGDLDREIRNLQRKIKDIEKKNQQQPNPKPVVAKASDPSADILMPQSELSISKSTVSIDVDDRQALQKAFLEWRTNSRSKKISDFLPSSFLEKIRQLGYEIVFAKAGVGLNLMIIDRKPPSNTRMVGLSSVAHSLMYCHDRASQGDECWTPNTWYEVTIDHPDDDDEQTVRQLEKLEELPT